MPTRSPTTATVPEHAAHPATLVPGLADPREHAADRLFATNLARGLQVMRAFTPDDPLLGNRELIERTGLPKATVWRLTYTLTLLGYLEYVERFHKFRLDSGVLSLGYPLLASMRVRHVARPLMEAIARETDCTVNLGMRDRLNIVYIETCRVDQGNVHSPDIGSTRPLLATAIGRALLLSLGQQERSAILNRLRLHDAADMARRANQLREDERRLAEQGHCRSQGDWRAEIHAVAVPVRQATGESMLALNATMAAYRTAPEALAALAVPRLREAARMIEHTLGLAP
ncbi:IclR family transcriptional regulator [Verticiella sediminum]|uniref:IclR family transcriptional regulator n=1 Tax=Verticiella sediminum TaxID=1247510 RepID=A0A556B0N6_9BURK|nr:IclR family transcriptional regulator [Verticiella sediminum]TSH98305.1 IclR family transcriptional regulator [Verticiella sediminum]